VLPFFAPDVHAAAGARFQIHYLRIEADGSVVVTSPVAELGQGTSTGLAMVVADAMDSDWKQMRFDLASVAPEYKNPLLGAQLTGASTGISAFRNAYRDAGARARAILMAAAARQWGVTVSECSTENGTVVLPGRKQISYGELARSAALLPTGAAGAAKPIKGTRFVGQSVPRLDIAGKVDGSAQYAVDIRLPNMLFAAVVQSPTFTGKLASDARTTVLARPGVRGVVDLSNGVAVVADKWWAAHRASLELAPQWREGANHGVTDETISAQLVEALKYDGGVVAKRTGDPSPVLANAEKLVTRRYEVPFLAHATMEPMSCVARVTKSACDIWVCSQLPDRAQEVAATALGLPVAAVKIHPVLGGGGFGRRQEPDVVLQAVQLAKAFPGRPIKVVWSREQDIRHDFYRPAGISEMSAGISKGQVLALRHRQASPSILPRMYPAVMKEYDFVAADGIYSLYGFTHQDAMWVRSETHVPTGMWRSVGASQTSFAIESFVDELAHEMGADPLAFRRERLSSNPRAVSALDRLAQLSGWHGYSVPGRALGLAISHKNGDCLVAQCAEVSYTESKLKIHRIWTVADPGETILPDAVRAQLEGAAVWGLTATLFGKISIRQGGVEEGNFDTYQMVRLADTPEFITDILNSGAPIEGAGEGGAPGIAPAVCNAVFRLTGKRIRRLPIVAELAKA
jgi:CO/xanthine dehydrogenase Mo-binding subunit